MHRNPYGELLRRLLPNQPAQPASVQVAPRGETAAWQGDFNQNWLANNGPLAGVGADPNAMVGSNATHRLGSSPTSLGGFADVPLEYWKYPNLYLSLVQLFHPQEVERGRAHANAALEQERQHLQSANDAVRFDADERRRRRTQTSGAM